MPSRLGHPDEYELVNRDSSEEETFDLDDADFQSNGLTTAESYATRRRSKNGVGSLLARLNPFSLRWGNRRAYSRIGSRHRPRPPKKSQLPPRRCSRSPRRCYFLVNGVLSVLFAVVILTAIFRPSYTNPPEHYLKLRQRIQESQENGRANPENQKIFIAASLYDSGGDLLNGAWAEAVLQLIDLLGNANTYLSIYENESDQGAEAAQREFEKKIQCQHSVVYDTDFSVNQVPKLKLPDGSERIKRIAYLAELRNKALSPLSKDHSVKYDKLLFLNDVIFDPVDAAQLLLSTNQDSQGVTHYRAACAVDFINPFKFYDTYASRDLEGYSMGVPFYPWFTTAGNSFSRQDVLEQNDAVRVKSCWGGMVAFDAHPFQAEEPLLFRATEDLYWDASECCLIHADLVQSDSQIYDDSVGIFMNPYVRVSYGAATLRWLHFTRRFERLYSLAHNVINRLVGLPWYNPRREEQPGETVEERIWIPDSKAAEGGSFQPTSRKSTGDGFCGKRMLQLIKETPRQGEKNWETVPVPSG